MATFCQSHKLLHSKEGHDPSQHPQTNDHVLHVVVLVSMPVSMPVVMVGMVTVSVAVGGNGVGDEVEEGVAQEPPGGEAEQDLEEGGVVTGVLERDAEEDEERSCTDEYCGDKGIGPQLP